MGKWSDLPVDLVELLEDSLMLYADKVRIRAVCLFWYLQLPKINREFPWLLQAVDNNIEASHSLFNPIDKKFYFLDLPNLLQGKICKGSSHGWVATVEDTINNSNNKQYSNRIYLINPLTSARIELPSRNKFPDVIKYNPYQVDEEYSVKTIDEEDWDDFQFYSSQVMNDMMTFKFVMSSDPSISDGEDCVIAALYGPYCRLACCTLKNKRWNPLPVKNMNGIEDSIFLDITFCKGKLHALILGGQVYQVLVFENINRVKPNPHITLIARHTLDPSNAITRHSLDPFTTTEEYLVESSDGSCLLIVERFIIVTETNIEDVEIHHTCYFKVRKVDPINRSIVELKSIGEDVLILGLNTPMSISSRNSIGYKGNHIYFTDSKFSYDREHTEVEDSEIGVFNLEDGTLQPLCGLKSNPKFLWPPPIWVNVHGSRICIKWKIDRKIGCIFFWGVTFGARDWS